MKKKMFLALVLLCMISLGIYAAVTTYCSDRILFKSDLSGCTVYLHNINCSSFPEYEVYTVTDQALVTNLIENCVCAEKLRPFNIIYDMILGDPKNTPALIFEADDCRYRIELIDAEKQLDLDYIHRDEPVILAEKESVANDAAEEWTWYCTLSADKYGTLLNLIEKYWDGTQPSVFSAVE